MLKNVLTFRNLAIIATFAAAVFLRSSPEAAAKAQGLLANFGIGSERVVAQDQSQTAPKQSQPTVQQGVAKPKSVAPAATRASKGERIANGHAFPKHRSEFKFETRQQMATYIDKVIASARGSNVRRLERGRVAYWDPRRRAVVIVDLNTRDGGTCFKPRRGRSYFAGLR